MDITITPSKLKGQVAPPPSKSQAHRALIAAALAEGESVISNVAFSQDIEATINCLENLGAHFVLDGSALDKPCAAGETWGQTPCLPCGAWLIQGWTAGKAVLRCGSSFLWLWRCGAAAFFRAGGG